MKSFSSLLYVLLCGVGLSTALGGDDDWRGQVTTAPDGSFPPLPSLKMHYVFGWSNVLEAAEADANIVRKGNEYRAAVTGKTEGLARTLWPLDAQHAASVQASPLAPERMGQVERYRKQTIETTLRFNAAGVDRQRKTSNAKNPDKWKRIDFAPMYDVISGILYVRSQPLRVGDRIGVVAFPGDSPYIAVVKVEKRETIRCMGKDQPAIRLSLDVRKLEVKKSKPTRAVPYSKFRSGTIWVSDDALRIPLRAEVHVYVGFVYGQLTSCDRL